MAEEQKSKFYKYLLGMHQRGKLTGPRVVSAKDHGWITEDEADELMGILLDAGQE